MNRWDEYFMSMAYFVATQSKDPSTHIGAVIVDSAHYVRSVGYNGLPRGADESKPERHARPEKYDWYAHAERNAVCSAASSGTRIAGCSMYTPGVPCTDCAKDIIQSGIKEVITHKRWDESLQPDASGAKVWSEVAVTSMQMFEECGVVWRQFDGLIRPISILRRGESLPYVNDKMLDVAALQKQLRYLLHRDRMLSALEAGGVDNWDWYSDSINDNYPECWDFEEDNGGA